MKHDKNVDIYTAVEDVNSNLYGMAIVLDCVSAADYFRNTPYADMLMLLADVCRDMAGRLDLGNFTE